MNETYKKNSAIESIISIADDNQIKTQKNRVMFYDKKFMFVRCEIISPIPRVSH